MLMCQDIGKPIFAVPSRLHVNAIDGRPLQAVLKNCRDIPGLKCSHSLYQYTDIARAYEWYQALGLTEKNTLETMILACTARREKVNTSTSKLYSSLEVKKKLDKQQKCAMQLANWEKKVIANKNNYADEVLKCHLNEEKNQETSWHAVRENVVDIDVFSSQRRLCVEVMTNFCSYYELDMKTIEASFVYLDRFLLLREAKTILESYSGVKGATGKHSLLAVAMCALIISSKYEEIYHPNLISFARVAKYSPKEFANLEVTLLLAMNWNLITTTPADYIGQFLYHANGANKTNFSLTKSIIEASWLAKMTCGNESPIFSSNNIRCLKS